MQRRHLLGAGAAAILPGFGTLLWSGAAAGAAPLETVKVLCGYPAGGTTDAVARRVADKLRGGYAKSTLVDNKAGASGRLAIEELKRSPADGSVLLVTPASSISLFPHIYNKLSYKIEDLAPVSTACRITFGFAVGPAVPASVKNLKDFVAWAKANPAQANFGSPGAGTPPHFIGTLLAHAAGIELRHVPYRGSAPAVQDLLGGQVAAVSAPIGEFMPHMGSGKLRILAASSDKRSSFAPDVPTYSEQGFKELQIYEYFQVMAPGRTPADVLQRASDAVRAAVMAPDVVEALAKLGLESMAMTPSELAASIKQENAAWGPIVKRAGFTPED